MMARIEQVIEQYPEIRAEVDEQLSLDFFSRLL